MFEIKKVQRILKCNSTLKKNRQANIWHDPTITTKENKQTILCESGQKRGKQLLNRVIRERKWNVISPTAFKPFKILEICLVISHFPHYHSWLLKYPLPHSLFPIPCLSFGMLIISFILKHISPIKPFLISTQCPRPPSLVPVLPSFDFSVLLYRLSKSFLYYSFVPFEGNNCPDCQLCLLNIFFLLLWLMVSISTVPFSTQLSTQIFNRFP